MKKVIIGLERTRFNYLYKYDYLRVSNSMILESDLEKLRRDFIIQPDEVISNLDDILPIYEREDEVLLIEVDSNLIDYQGNFSFSAVQRLIPLNETARELFLNKLNSSLSFDEVLPNEISSSLWIFRQERLRSKCASEVLSVLGLEPVSEKSRIQLTESLITKMSCDNNAHNKTSSLGALLKLETTPSGIPEGNIEALSKIIGVGYIKHGQPTRTLLQSPLYHLLNDNQEMLNRLSFQEALNMFENLIAGNKSADSLRETLDSREIEGDIFRFCYYFFGLKRQLEIKKDDLNIIEDLCVHGGLSILEFSQAVYLLALVMSYERLHESLQRLKKAPLIMIEGNDSYNEVPSKCSDVEKNESIKEIFEGKNPENEELLPIKLELKDNSSVDFSKGQSRASITDNSRVVEPTDSGSRQNKDTQSISNTLFQNDTNERLELLKKSQLVTGKLVKKAREKAHEVYSGNESFSFSDLKKQFLSEKDFLKLNGELKKGPADILQIFEELD